MEIINGIQKCSMPVKNTDKITNQAKINDWDCCDMEAKAQLTSDLEG